jgi:hypothetical protein
MIDFEFSGSYISPLEKGGLRGIFQPEHRTVK